MLGSTTSPDGTNWCILNVRLEGRVSRTSLRALWDSLRKEQPKEWGRFTCRFCLHGDSWADVNEIAIIESPPAPSPETLAAAGEEGETGYEDEEPVILNGVRSTGEVFCDILFRGRLIRLPAAADRVSIRGSGADLEIDYWDEEERRLKSIRLADLEGPPLPRCGGAWLR